MAKIKIKQINELYNLIVVERNYLYDYYLEKENYGDLFFMFGLAEKVEITNELIIEYIKVAEKQGFWG